MKNLQLKGNRISFIGQYDYKIKETMYSKHRFFHLQIKSKLKYKSIANYQQNKKKRRISD